MRSLQNGVHACGCFLLLQRGLVSLSPGCVVEVAFDGGAGGIINYPALVLAVFAMGIPPDVADEDEVLQDMLFIQWFDDVRSAAAGPLRHPRVPDCRYVRLHSSFALIPQQDALRPCLLYPNLASRHECESWDRNWKSKITPWFCISL